MMILLDLHVDARLSREKKEQLFPSFYLLSFNINVTPFLNNFHIKTLCTNVNVMYILQLAVSNDYQGSPRTDKVAVKDFWLHFVFYCGIDACL